MNKVYREKLLKLRQRGYKEFDRELEELHFAKAAVVILLWPVNNNLDILFTKRTQHLPSHSGQVSFPGGGAEPQDKTLVDTAIRETWEETGITLTHDSIVGRLDDAWSVSRRHVIPYVALLEEPVSVRPNPNEVSRIFHGSLQRLIRPEALNIRTLTFEGVDFTDQVYEVDGETVWGLTSDILTEFLDWMRDTPEPGHRCIYREQELDEFLKRFPERGGMERE